MSIYLPERNLMGGGSDFDIDEWDARLAAADGGSKRRYEIEPYPVQHLVGRVGLEGAIITAETSLENGQPLDAAETSLLHQVEEDFFDENYDL